MTKELVESLSIKYLPLIIEHYGSSTFQPCSPEILVDDNPYYDNEDDDEDDEIITDDIPEHLGLGEYTFDYQNEIVLYWKNINTVEDLLRTLIHEYIHHLQSPTWYRRYWRMGYTYETHPYEIEAFEAENNWEFFVVS